MVETEIDVETVGRMQSTWSSGQDVQGVLRVLDAGPANGSINSRQIADYLIAAFSVSPIAIGLVREWKDGRMSTEDFNEAIAELISDATSLGSSNP